MKMNSPAHPGLTNREDFWWLMPLMMLVVGGAALVYLTYAAFVGDFYSWGPYVSPVYSTPYVPEWWKISPAFLLLWIPAGFRITCYYGRKVYHRAAFGAPGACAVEQPYRKIYKGESRLPFVLNNLHRYFLYFALALVVLHWYEFFASVFHNGDVYLGVGTLILLVDTLALTFYVGGCHSLRHVIGGKKRAVFGCSGCSKKCHKVREDDETKRSTSLISSLPSHRIGSYASVSRSSFSRISSLFRHLSFSMWKTVTKFNIFHNVWFWVSLVSIAFADLYIRLLAMGVLTSDPHLLF